MDISTTDMGQRLRAERQRLGLNQAEVCTAGGVKPRAQVYYESGERSPDGVYWARMVALGMDVHYILTGERSGAAAYLSPDEDWLLHTWEALTPRRRACWRELLGEPPAIRDDPAAPYPPQEPGE